MTRDSTDVKNRRYEMLKEMGLTPVWEWRDSAVVSGVDETVITEPPAASAITTVESRVPSQRSATDDEPRATNHESRLCRGDDRRGQIMSMAWPELNARVASCVD